MKLVYEDLILEESKRSFNLFEVNVDVLPPFWHYHPEVELTLIYQGIGTRFVGDSILPYEPMDLVLVGENIPHHWVSAGSIKSNPQKAVVIQFPKELFDSFPECQIFQDFFKKSERAIHFLQPSPKLIEILMNFGNVSDTEQLSLLIKILFELTEHTNQCLLLSSSYKNPIINEKNQDKTAKVTSYILEHLNKKLTVEEMADYTNLVPQSFCRWFKNATGNTFVNYVNKARIEHACQYLLNTEMSVSEICYSVGFESLSHFSRTFLKIKEVNPSKFRKISN